MKFLRASLLFTTVVLFGYQAADPWRANGLVQPADAAAKLARNKSDQPIILQVGFQALYKGARIPGSKYAGPGATAEGLANLERAVKDVPRGRAILMYCGCCPWEKCPNVRPAFTRLKQLGFTKIEVLKIATNVHTDWVEHGYPIEKDQ